MSRKVLRIMLTLGMTLATFTWAALPAQAAGTVLFCPSNQAMLEAAIGAAGPGGTMLFSCNTSITLTSTIALADVTLDGNGFDVTLDGNDAVRIFTVSGTVSLIGLHLTHGFSSAYLDGGAIYAASGSVLTVTSSVLDENHADYSGGAIYGYNVTTTIVDSTLNGNSVQQLYGGALSISGSLTIYGSTLSNNSSGWAAGAIDFSGEQVSLTNSTLTGNTAGAGGAMLANGDVTLTNSTFYGNQATWGYRDDYMYGNSLLFPTSGSTLTMTNTIMVSYTKGECAVDSSNGINPIDNGGNLLSDDSCASNDSHVNPIGTQINLTDLDVDALADNGGPTQTLALGENSVAIGAGVLAACAAAPVNGLDQRGYTRPTTTCDSGAFDSGAIAPDSTAPVITPTVNGTLGSNGWYTSDVAVSWSVVDDESAISSSTGCEATTVTADTTGTTFTCEATSAGGTASQSVTIQRDATAPIVTVTGVTDGATYLYEHVPAAGCTTTDATSGVQTAATPTPSGGPAGEITVTCAGAVDNAGNTSAASVTYTVEYDWQGFVSAADGPRGPRKVLAGLPMTVVFMINGDVGVDAVESITTIACNAGPGAQPTPAQLAGSRGALQQGAGNSFIFQWQTSRSMAGTCQLIQVHLADGTTHAQAYQFQR